MDKYAVRSGKSAANLCRYDVVCLIPTDEKLFADCCKEIECDLIGFAETSQFDPRRGSVLAALARNIQFELNYADWLRYVVELVFQKNNLTFVIAILLYESAESP